MWGQRAERLGLRSEGREVRRRWPGLHPVPVPAGVPELCRGVPVSPHGVQVQGGLVVGVGG